MNGVYTSDWTIKILMDVEAFLQANGMHESAAAVSLATAAVRCESRADPAASLDPVISQTVSFGNVVSFSVVSQRRL